MSEIIKVGNKIPLVDGKAIKAIEGGGGLPANLIVFEYTPSVDAPTITLPIEVPTMPIYTYVWCNDADLPATPANPSLISSRTLVSANARKTTTSSVTTPNTTGYTFLRTTAGAQDYWSNGTQVIYDGAAKTISYNFTFRSNINLCAGVKYTFLILEAAD